MLGGDARLRVVPGEDVAVSRPGQPEEAGLDLRLVPARAILFFEQQETAGAILSGSHARRVEVHQGEERERLGRSTDGVLGEELGQPLRLVAKLSPYRMLCVGRK